MNSAEEKIIINYNETFFRYNDDEGIIKSTFGDCLYNLEFIKSLKRIKNFEVSFKRYDLTTDLDYMDSERELKVDLIEIKNHDNNKLIWEKSSLEFEEKENYTSKDEDIAHNGMELCECFEAYILRPEGSGYELPNIDHETKKRSILIKSSIEDTRFPTEDIISLIIGHCGTNRHLKKIVSDEKYGVFMETLLEEISYISDIPGILEDYHGVNDSYEDCFDIYLEKSSKKECIDYFLKVYNEAKE